MKPLEYFKFEIQFRFQWHSIQKHHKKDFLCRRKAYKSSLSDILAPCAFSHECFLLFRDAQLDVVILLAMGHYNKIKVLYTTFSLKSLQKTGRLWKRESGQLPEVNSLGDGDSEWITYRKVPCTSIGDTGLKLMILDFKNKTNHWGI